MAELTVNQGLQAIGEQGSFAAPTFGRIQTMSVDDGASALAATDTTPSSGSAPTNFLAKAFDSNPTRATQVITHIMTLAVGDFNTFTIKRVLLHFLASGAVTKNSVSLIGGIDSLSLVKQNTFSLTLTLTLTYSAI